VAGVNSWGQWGPEDEAGALNFVTPEKVKESVGLVETGKIISLAHVFGPNAAVAPHRKSPARFMDRDAGDYALGARAPGGFKFAEDTVQFATHSGTHVDALSHAWSGDQLYNGHSDSYTRSTKGAQKCGAEKLRPIITRGILVDLVEFLGKPLAASFQISPKHLADYYASHNISSQPGDAVLIRTGWSEQGLDPHLYHEDEPGLNIEAARWLVKNQIAIVGADNYAVEAQPSSPEANFPVHLFLLHQNGVPLIENLDLSKLAEHKRKIFLFVMSPLLLVGSTASPITPLAVL